MAASMQSKMMGAAILRRAGQQALQGAVNYSGTGSGGAAPQMEKRPGASIPQSNPGTGMAVAARPVKPRPAPVAQSVQRTAVPFAAGAQQRAGYAQGAPLQRTTAAPPPQQSGPQVKARPSRIPVRSPVDTVNVQRASMPRVLGPVVPTQAYDPNAGRERADQSLIRPVAYVDDGGSGGSQRSGPTPGSAEWFRQAVATMGENAEQDVQGGRFGGSRTPFTPFAEGTNPYSGLIGRIGGALFDPAAELSGAISNSVNAQVEDFDEKYMGEYDVASDKIRDAGSNLLDPEAQAAAEAAARESMYSGIGRERDAAVAQMLDRSNRGGRTGSGSTQAAYQAAIAAAQEGERGLVQDAFGRRLQATGAGANLLGQGAGMDYQKLRDYYMDPSKAMELLFAMGPDAMDALNPFPF